MALSRLWWGPVYGWQREGSDWQCREQSQLGLCCFDFGSAEFQQSSVNFGLGTEGAWFSTVSPSELSPRQSWWRPASQGHQPRCGPLRSGGSCSALFPSRGLFLTDRQVVGAGGWAERSRPCTGEFCFPDN